MDKGYLIRKIAEITGVPCPCGTSFRAITRKDTEIANIHLTHIVNAQRHYHKKCTEFYYILEGRGKMELGEEVIDVEPGTVIMIAKGTPHAGRGDFRALIIGVPALQEDDEYIIA